MKWEKMSQETAGRLATLVEPFACQKKPMFGHVAYFINGSMFTGVFASSIWLRLSEKDRAEFLKIPGAKPFEPMAGRPMKEYVVAPEPVLADRAAANEWLKRSYDYVAGLPEKKAKKGTGKK